jgi:hypothetical protein
VDGAYDERAVRDAKRIVRRASGAGSRLAIASLSLAACGRVVTSVGAEDAGSGVSSIPDAGSIADAGPIADAGTPPPAPTSVYLEAEDGELEGFTIASDPAASGGKYILPPPGSDAPNAPGDASAAYSFALGRTGTYLVWGRIEAPTVSSNAFWVTVDDRPPVRWQLSTGDIWFWGAITSGTDYFNPVVYPLEAGAHTLVVNDSVPGVGLDRLYVTVPGDVPPGNTTPCDPPNSIQLDDGGCEPSCGSHGDTTCGPPCAGQPALAAYDCVVCCTIPDSGAADASAE